LFDVVFADGGKGTATFFSKVFFRDHYPIRQAVTIITPPFMSILPNRQDSPSISDGIIVLQATVARIDANSFVQALSQIKPNTAMKSNI
jgi:hypothetical protein